jgi:Uma2 family endonuclease
MLEAGLFAGQRYELIEGDLLEKMGQNPPHAYAISLLLTWLAGIYGVNRVRVQLPMEAGPEDRERSEPEPDLAVLFETKPDYQVRHPSGEELLLLVEVAESSSRFDLSVKGELYARARVPEYWVLDLGRRVLTVHRRPEQGRYQVVLRVSEGENVAPEGRGDLAIPLATLMPAGG